MRRGAGLAGFMAVSGSSDNTIAGERLHFLSQMHHRWIMFMQIESHFPYFILSWDVCTHLIFLPFDLTLFFGGL